MDNTHSLTSPFFVENYYTNPNLTPILNFNIFSNEYEYDSLNDSYTNTKINNQLICDTYSNYLGLYNTSNQALTYTHVLNTFRARSEEPIMSSESLNTQNELDTISVNDSNDIRVNNYIKLRSTAKSAIKTYTAIHKVFKFRFDEGRSNVHLNSFSNMSVTAPFISEKRTNYESLLGKNKETFFLPINYKTLLTKVYSNITPSINILNMYFANIPFLLSRLSDPSKFI
jgi:hypothetical protein